MSQNSSVSFIKRIRELGLTVPRLEITTIGGLNFVSAFDERPTAVMANDATAGVDYDPNIAVIKALVEYFERRVFADGVDLRLNVCERRHSDGVAAFPQIEADAGDRARGNAYCEALERFVWSHWWDNSDNGHKLENFEDSRFWKNIKIRMSVEAFREFLSFDNIQIITPNQSDHNHIVIILFAAISGKGFISGGAAGKTGSETEIIVRALAELIRHGVALKRFLDFDLKPQSFYEKRLVHFGLGYGKDLVLTKLNRNSELSVQIPDLAFDERIPSDKFSELILTHRCLFQNQPPFVDGEMERLCL